MQSMAIAGVTARQLRDRLPSVVRGWRLWLLVGSAALAAGVAWQWSWLLAIGVLPFLLSVAPCAAMCALGLCASRLVGSSCQTGSGSNPPATARLPAQNNPRDTTIGN